MPVLASLSLFVLHLIYSLAVTISSTCNYLQRKSPLLLTAHRNRIPKHLAILLVSGDGLDADQIEQVFVESVEKAVIWSRLVGIERLSVYDQDGVLVRCSRDILQRLAIDPHPVYNENSDSDVEYPLTPPASDHSGSRPLSPEFEGSVESLSVVTFQVPHCAKPRKSRVGVKRRQSLQKADADFTTPLVVSLLSRWSAKPAIASMTRLLTRSRRKYNVDRKQVSLSIEDINSILQGQGGVQAPELMLVHHTTPAYYNRKPLELYGFPPWQIRLTEIHYGKVIHTPCDWWSRTATHQCVPLDESEFREALDDYARAEMRLGK